MVYLLTYGHLLLFVTVTNHFAKNNNKNDRVFYSTQCNPGIYLAVLFYQRGIKLGKFFTRLVKKNS